MTAKQHELVIQFLGAGEEVLGNVQDLEDQLIEALGDRADVDGHEEGTSTVSLKIHCANAETAWGRIERLVEDASDLELHAVAFRPLDGDDYTVIWPTDFDGEFEV